MSVAVCADPADDRSLQMASEKLAAQLNLPQVESVQQGGEHRMLLMVTAQRLELKVMGDPGRDFYVDMNRVDAMSAMGRRLKQPLAKALGIKRRADLPIQVIDATAGWGEDSWLMAGIGCDVFAVERHPVVRALLRDGLRRGAMDWPEIAGRITLGDVDAHELLANNKQAAHVVYLDPMYPSPPGGRKTAVRKAMKVIRDLVGDDEDASQLFEAAMGAARNRVVVKRPARAKPLGGEPVCSHKGKGVRYDVYSITNR